MTCAICNCEVESGAICGHCQADEMNQRRRMSLAAPPCCAAVAAENRELRIMLAIAHAGLELYADDGELQDNRCHPWIDFKRDSVAQIEQKLHERAYKQARRHNND